MVSPTGHETGCPESHDFFQAAQVSGTIPISFVRGESRSRANANPDIPEPIPIGKQITDGALAMDKNSAPSVACPSITFGSNEGTNRASLTIGVFRVQSKDSSREPPYLTTAAPADCIF